jgi:hypothetical protein
MVCEGGSHWFGFRSLLLRMELRINKQDFDRLVSALVIASESETNANKKRLYTLTRKKLSRQNEVFLKKSQKRTRGI